MASGERSKLKYNRVVLKLSGELFQNRKKGLSVDPDVTSSVAKRIKTVLGMGQEIALVVGGGNIFRGLSGELSGIDRGSGDYMGMLATVINGLALQNALEKAGVEACVQTAIAIDKVAEPFVLKRALAHLSKGRVLIFTGGTGNPYFSTDTAAALRASEIGADVLLKATKVSGVYSSDPLKNPKAKRYTTLRYSDALRRSLKIMDATAFSLCMENKIPIVVFDFFERGSIEGILRGRRVGTLVHE